MITDGEILGRVPILLGAIYYVPWSHKMEAANSAAGPARDRQGPPKAFAELSRGLVRRGAGRLARPEVPLECQGHPSLSARSGDTMCTEHISLAHISSCSCAAAGRSRRWVGTLNQANEAPQWRHVGGGGSVTVMTKASRKDSTSATARDAGRDLPLDAGGSTCQICCISRTPQAAARV